MLRLESKDGESLERMAQPEQRLDKTSAPILQGLNNCVTHSSGAPEQRGRAQTCGSLLVVSQPDRQQL